MILCLDSWAIFVDSHTERVKSTITHASRFASDWRAKSPQRSASSGLPRGVFDILREILYIQSTLSWNLGLRCSSLVAAKHLSRKDDI